MADRPMFYPACPECKKKVIPDDSGRGWHCEKCQKVYEEPNWTYNFSVRVGDFTDDIYVQVLGENVGDQILKMNAKDFKAMQDQDMNGLEQGNPNSQFRQYLDSLCNKEFVFLVRCKVDMYTMGSDNDANRVRFYLSKILPADSKI